MSIALRSIVFATALVGILPQPLFAQSPAVSVAKWKDDKRAAFVLGFDDSAPSQLKNVVPELQRRKIVGTFYLVTGNKLYASLKSQWEEAAKSPFIVVANHTFTHKGVNSADELEPEFAKCNDVLYALHPEKKQPYLLSWGKPGSVPWMASKEEVAAALEKNHLVERPPFAGPPINYKSAAETVASVDKALAKGDLGYLIFHGVGGDWLVTPMDWFTALLDKLESSREQLWITDMLSAQRYQKERESAEVKAVESSKDRLRLALTSKMDPALYDEPLTVKATVPGDWKKCRVKQGEAEQTVEAKDGAVRFDAVPNRAEIVIEPAKS